MLLETVSAAESVAGCGDGVVLKEEGIEEVAVTEELGEAEANTLRLGGTGDGEGENVEEGKISFI